MRRSVPDTVNGLIESNYTIGGFSESSFDEFLMKKGFKLFPFTKYNECLKNKKAICDPKMALLFPKIYNFHGKVLEQSLKSSYQYGLTYKFTKDNIFQITQGLSLPKNSIFFVLFKTEFQKLFESGIVQKFKFKSFFSYDEYRYDQKEISIFKIHQEGKEVVPLSLSHLEAGFVIWLVTVLISIFVFLIENIYYQISKTYQTNKIIVIQKLNRKKTNRRRLSKLKLFQHKFKNNKLKKKKLKISRKVEKSKMKIRKFLY